MPARPAGAGCVRARRQAVRARRLRGAGACRRQQDKVELAIAPPAQHAAGKMAERVAAALAIELQSYGIVAAVQPAPAPIQVSGAMSTRDAGRHRHRDPDRMARRRQARQSQDPAISRTRDAAGGLRRGERPAGVAHRPAGRAARRHPDGQAADLPGALARPGRCRRQRAASRADRPVQQRPRPPATRAPVAGRRRRSRRQPASSRSR